MSISYMYLESGYFTDLLPKIIEILKPLYPHIRASNFLPWKVYTTKDQELCRKRFPTNTGNQTTHNKKAQWTIEYMALVVDMNQSTPSRNDFLFNNWG